MTLTKAEMFSGNFNCFRGTNAHSQIKKLSIESLFHEDSLSSKRRFLHKNQESHMDNWMTPNPTP